jgi:hypothetical protein
MHIKTTEETINNIVDKCKNIFPVLYWKKCLNLEYMTNLTTDTWDTLIEKSRNSSGLRCTLDGRRETTCLEEAIEKEPSVDEREYLEVVKHAVPKQINPFHLVGLLHELTSRLGNDIFLANSLRILVFCSGCLITST